MDINEAFAILGLPSTASLEEITLEEIINAFQIALLETLPKDITKKEIQEAFEEIINESIPLINISGKEKDIDLEKIFKIKEAFIKLQFYRYLKKTEIAKELKEEDKSKKENIKYIYEFDYKEICRDLKLGIKRYFYLDKGDIDDIYQNSRKRYLKATIAYNFIRKIPRDHWTNWISIEKKDIKKWKRACKTLGIPYNGQGFEYAYTNAKESFRKSIRAYGTLKNVFQKEYHYHIKKARFQAILSIIGVTVASMLLFFIFKYFDQ
ncbi:MAG: hypothetical protein NT009_05065 [Proteobacteria bacterium]|nr:hypothetical protein [Pseudomonadota bacterium]